MPPSGSILSSSPSNINGIKTKFCLIFSVDTIAIPIVHMHLCLSRHSGLLLEFKELQIQKVYLQFPSPLVSSSLKLGIAPLP